MACCCLGISFNSLALIYFQKQTTDFKLKVVFLAATCVDMLICCLCPFVVASLLHGRQPLAFSQDLFCQLWGFCWSFASKYSAYIVSIASIVRVLLMYSPKLVTFTKMKIGLVTGAALLLLVEAFPYFYREKLVFLEQVGACTPAGFVFEYMTPFTPRGVLLSYVPALSYLLPIPTCLSCYILSCVKLWRCPQINAKHRGSRKRTFRLQAVLTITSFMSAYLLLQVPLPIYALFVMAKMFSGSSVLDAVVSNPWWFSFYMPHILYIVSVSLNAALNPVIYYWRLLEFRRFVKEFVFRIPYVDLTQSLGTPKFSLLRENIREWNLEMLRVERRDIPLEEDKWETAIDHVSSYDSSVEERWVTAFEQI